VRDQPRARTIAALYLGDIRADQGRLDEALPLLEHARTAPTPAPALMLGHVASSLAGVLARLGRADEADAVLAPADRPLTRTPSYVARRELTVAEIAAARGHLAAVEAALDRAVAAWAGPLGSRLAELRALCSNGASPRALRLR
jgi:predicted negative regulator of RcsB-dependent stress response